MSDRSFRVAVVGATGLVGTEILAVLEERAFPISELFLFAAEEAPGTEVEFGAESRKVRPLPSEFPAVDVAFLCATPEISEKLGPSLAAKGALVVDLEGRAAPVVLGPADVSAEDAKQPIGIADPVVRLIVAPLRALAEVVKPSRVIATVVAPASAFGREAADRLGEETIALLNTRGSEEDLEEEDDEEEEDETPRPEETTMAFRCAPVDRASALALRVQTQAKALLGDLTPVVQIMRAPVFFGQMASLSIEVDGAIDIDKVRTALREAPSVILVEGEVGGLSTFDVLGIDAVQVTGIRHDPDAPSWLHFWAISDNVRQGAALPAVALAEGLLLRN